MTVLSHKDRVHPDITFLLCLFNSSPGLTQVFSPDRGYTTHHIDVKAHIPLVSSHKTLALFISATLFGGKTQCNSAVQAASRENMSGQRFGSEPYFRIKMDPDLKCHLSVFPMENLTMSYLTR